MEEGIERPIFRVLADAVTESRPLGAAAICADIVGDAPDFRSWKLAGKLGLVLATDGVDGHLARYSNIPSVSGATRDEEYDKLIYSMLMYSLAYGSNDHRYIGYALTNELRNTWVKHRRDQLREHQLPAGARSLGKWKMGAQATGLFFDLSPVGKTHSSFVHNLHIASAGLAIVSGVDIELNAREQLKTLRKTL